MGFLSMSCVTGLLAVLVCTISAAGGTQSGSEKYLTGETGHHVGSNQNSQAATENGGLLLQDSYVLEKLRRFNSERTAERVVHARGAGAHGFFESYMDLSKYTTAKFLSAKGIKTEVFTRFSTVIHGTGSPETVRDPRGFAVKMFTESEGNWDLVSNNLPVFFINDHIKFPDMVHSLKPDPVTNKQNPNRYFDFFSAIGGMATNMLTYIYSDLGIPRSFRFMDGNSVHAYKFVNAAGDVTYVKFRWFTNQGVKNLTAAEAAEIQSKDFGHATADLYSAIKAGDFPSWELAIQTMDPSQLDDFEFNPLDATKIWPDDKFPLTKIGRMVLDRVPDNFFLFTEQVAFCPGNYLPGAIEPSEDRLLQGRLISYKESQTHRMRSNNFNDLPVNRAKSPVNSYGQNGVMAHNHNYEGSINYEPSNHRPTTFQEDSKCLYSKKEVCGASTQSSIRKTLRFKQAGDLYRSLSPEDQSNLISNLAGDLGQVTSDMVRNKMCAHFYKADADYGSKISEAVKCNKARVKALVSELEE